LAFSLLALCLLILVGGIYVHYFINSKDTTSLISEIRPSITTTVEKITRNTKTELPQIPAEKTLRGGTHVFQRYNNCGPAALSMALSYYGINISQEELGSNLRPYQVASGDNDDKSTTLEELAAKSKEYGFVPFHRPVGSAEVIKQFIAHDMPVITRTWTKPDEDIGHYRVIKGYNENGFIQ